MADIHLYDNYSDTWSEASAIDQAIGLRFKVTEERAVTHLRWRRMSAGTGRAPYYLRLYTIAGVLLHDATSIPDSGAIGWQEYALSSPVTLVANDGYVVAAGWLSGTPRGNVQQATVPSPPSPLAFWSSGPGCYTNAGHTSFPDSSDGTYFPLDVGVDVVVPPPPPDTDQISYAQLRDEEYRWLSTDSTINAHQGDGLPWRTDANVTTVKGEAEGVNGFAAIKAVADAIASAVGGLPGTIASAVTTLTGQISSAVVAIAGAGGHTIADIFGDTTTLLSHIADLIAGNAGGTSGALSGRSGFPTMLWTLADERDWTGQLAWAVPADLYVLSITDANGAPPTVVDGVNWYPRLGWWAPLTSTLVGDRRFFEFDACRLEDGGRRMAGILIKANDGLVTGHIQAWVLT